MDLRIKLPNFIFYLYLNLVVCPSMLRRYTILDFNILIVPAFNFCCISLQILLCPFFHAAFKHFLEQSHNAPLHPEHFLVAFVIVPQYVTARNSDSHLFYHMQRLDRLFKYYLNFCSTSSRLTNPKNSTTNNAS